MRAWANMGWVAKGSPMFYQFLFGPREIRPGRIIPRIPCERIVTLDLPRPVLFFPILTVLPRVMYFQDQMHLKIGRMGSNICSLKFMFPYVVSNVVYTFNSPFFG